MTIETCPHSSGMGICSACAADQDRRANDAERRAKKRERLEDLAKGLSGQGEHVAARRLREKASKL